MKVEFLSKYGLISEYANLSKKVLISLASGEFNVAKAWKWLELHPPEDEDDPMIGSMLVLEGMVIGQFDSLDDAAAWLQAVQKQLVEQLATERTPSLLTIIFDQDGNPIAEGNIDTIQLTQEVNNERE